MKIVVLDRDGVINADSTAYIKSADEWIPIPGSIHAIASLCKAGYTVCVASNQSGIGRGLFDTDALSAIHNKLCVAVEEAGGEVAGIFYCPHLPADRCECRKPGVGLLQQIEAEFHCSLSSASFIGDSLKDVQAALTFGCTPMLVRTGKGLQTETELRELQLEAVAVFDDLAAAAKHILAVSSQGR
jgi:D-glycero-D-manno-heptose 1,7-bisphosphate phosphatase